MTGNKKKPAGKNRKGNIGIMSRPEFIKTTGLTAAGIGAAAMGISGVAQAEGAVKPILNPGKIFDKATENNSPISVVKIDPLLSYATAYNLDGTIASDGIPELLQKYIWSFETDEGSWEKIVEKIDFLYERFDDVFNALFYENPDLLSNIQNAIGKKFLLKPNWVTPLEDIDGAFVREGVFYDPFELTSYDPATNTGDTHILGMGEGWGGSTPWPFMAALMLWLNKKLEVPFNDMLIAEGGDKSEYDVKLMNLFARAPIFTLPIIYEGKMVDQDNNAIWYGGIGMYWARKYLVEKTGDASAMAGYFNSVTQTYLSPASAMGITLYNSNDNRGHAGLLPVPDLNGNNKDPNNSPPYPWENGVDPDHRVYNIAAHEAFTDSSVGFLINIPKLKVHPLGNITFAMKNLGIGIPAAWAKDTNGDWLYDLPQNADEPTGVPCEKWNIPHELHYGHVDRNGIPSLNYADPNPYVMYLPTMPTPTPIHIPHYDTHRTGGMGGFIMDVNLAVKKRFGSSILHVGDGIVAANAWHEASGVEALKVLLVNEGMIFASADPVALDKCALRYVYKKVHVGSFGTNGVFTCPVGAFLNYSFNSSFDTVTGQLKGSVGGDITTTELSDNRTAWAMAANLGNGHYYVVGQEIDKDNKVNSKLGSVNEHVVRLTLGKLTERTVEEVISPNIYYTLTPILTQFSTSMSYYQAVDDLGTHVLGRPLLISPHFCWPLPSTTIPKNSNLLGQTGEIIADGILQMDELGGDAALLGYGTVSLNVPRDIVLRRLLAGDISAPYKAQFYGNCFMNRYLDPIWNNETQYFFGGSQFAMDVLIAWKMAMAPGNPSAANADWYFYGITGHLLIYGTYGAQITHVKDPNGNPVPLSAFGLPNLDPGTYWPSGHFAMWVSSITYLFGADFFNPTSPERFAGSAYEAAKEYATATGMTLKLYVPSRFYYPLLNQLPSSVIPDLQPLPDLGDPGYDPNVHPKLYFKAEFYFGSTLMDRWPDSYMIPPQYP